MVMVVAGRGGGGGVKNTLTLRLLMLVGALCKKDQAMSHIMFLLGRRDDGIIINMIRGGCQLLGHG